MPIHQPLRSRKYDQPDYHETIISETPEGPSLTVPDQSLTLQQLLERYVMGQSVETFQGHYNEHDDDIPEGIERMDKTEKLTLARKIRENIAQQQELLQQPPTPPTPPPPGE